MTDPLKIFRFAVDDGPCCPCPDACTNGLPDELLLDLTTNNVLSNRDCAECDALQQNYVVARDSPADYESGPGGQWCYHIYQYTLPSPLCGFTRVVAYVRTSRVLQPPHIEFVGCYFSDEANYPLSASDIGWHGYPGPVVGQDCKAWDELEIARSRVGRLKCLVNFGEYVLITSL